MTVDSVQQKTSSGFPYGTLVLGGAVGAGATALTKYGKTPATLQDAMNSANGDTFVKSLTGELDAEKKKQAEILKTEIDKAKKATPSTTGTTAGTTTKPVSEAASKKEILNKVRSQVDNTFGANGETSVKNILGYTSVETYENTILKKQLDANDVLNKQLDKLNEELTTNNEKLSSSRNNLKTQEEIAQKTKATPEETSIKKSMEKDLATAKKELTEAQTKLKDAPKSLNEDELQVLKDNVKEKTRKVVNLKKDLRPEFKKVAGQFSEDVINANTEVKEAAEQLTKTTDDAKGALREYNTARGTKAPVEEIKVKKEAYDNLCKEITEKQNILNDKIAKRKEYAKIFKESRNADASKRIGSATARVDEYAQTQKELQGKISTATKELESGLSKQALMETKLELAKEAQDGKVTVSAFKEKYAGKLGDVKVAENVKAGTVAEAFSKKATAAFEALKGHMPTKMAAGKIAIGAGIGAAVFLLGKALFGGSKKEQA